MNAQTLSASRVSRRAPRRGRGSASVGLMFVFAVVACTDPTAPPTDLESLAVEEPEVVLLDFERYPDGSIPCGGAGRCPLSDQYASLGVTFRAENGHPNCGADRVWLTHPTGGYDAPGSPPNRAAGNDCSVGSFWVDLAALPDTVDFDIWMNDGVDVEIEAYTESGERLPPGSVAREARRYTTPAGFTFRRERVRISSVAGTATFGWRTAYFGVFLDDVRFVR